VYFSNDQDRVRMLRSRSGGARVILGGRVVLSDHDQLSPKTLSGEIRAWLKSWIACPRVLRRNKWSGAENKRSCHPAPLDNYLGNVSVTPIESTRMAKVSGQTRSSAFQRIKLVLLSTSHPRGIESQRTGSRKKPARFLSGNCPN